MRKTLFKPDLKALIDGMADRGPRGMIFRAVFSILLIVPLLLLIAFGYVSTYRQFTSSIFSEKKAIAQLSSTIVSERLDVLSQIGSSIAGRPVVIDNVMASNWEGAVSGLTNVFSSFPFIDAIFFIDTRGILEQGFSSYQKMGRDYSFDDLIGQDYSFRDYYKGVSAHWAPYISEVHTRANAPKNNVVAVAVPIKDYNEVKVLGVLVMQIQLHVFVQWMDEMSTGPREFIYIVDHKGHLVYHPERDTKNDIIDYSQAPAVRKLLKGMSGAGIDYEQAKKQEYLVAYAPVHKYGWGVVVAQPARAAFIDRDRNSGFSLIIYGIILILYLLFVFLIIRTLVERRRMEIELRKSDTRYRGLYSSIRDGLVLTDMKGALVDCNQAFLDMLGFSRDDLGKMSPQDYTPEKWHALEKSIVESQVFSRGYSGEFEKEFIRENGQIFPVLMRIWLVKDERGDPAGLWAIVRDITQRKAAEDEIRNLNAQLHDHARELEVVNKELQAFSYSVSHDLRAPLRAMEGFSKILLAEHGDKIDIRCKDYLTRISSAAKTMATLIDDLLNLAKVVRAPCNKVEFDLSALAGEVAAELSAAYPDPVVQCGIAPGMKARGDIQLCKIALENLLGNAWKFTSKVQRPLVEIGAMEKDGRTVFFVRDNGAGFDMEFSNKLFSPFQRLHSAAEFPGSGVGLASVHRIICRHGGEIWAEGQVNKGAIFYFTL